MTVTIGGETFAYDGYRVLEPEVTFDIHTKTAHDFVADFDTVYPVTRESYLLTSGADTETTVVKIVGQDPGPTLYVAAGIPLDERVARHICGIVQLCNAYNELGNQETIELGGLPSYQEILTNGIGRYLSPGK